MYWVINPGSGKTIEVMLGGFDFTWSHNRQFVARMDVMADWGSREKKGKPLGEHDGVLLNRDGLFVYPSERTGGQSMDDGETHDLGYGAMPRFVWSLDDKWVAFTDLIGPQAIGMWLSSVQAVRCYATPCRSIRTSTQL